MARFGIARFAPALAALTFAAVAAASSLKVIDKPDVTFTATGPGGLKINGHGNQLTAAEDGGKLVLKASLKNLKTGIGLRDKHTGRYLGVEQFPDASLTVEKSAIKMPADKQEVSGSATGKFRLHGVTKDKKFNYTVKRLGSDLLVNGNFEVNITDHGIEKPCYLGVCTDTKVKVTAKFKLRES